MVARHMDYPSPRGVHVPETFYSNDPDDPYRRQPSRRNRYSRSVQQTPRIRDVAWISSPEPTYDTPNALQSPWQPLPQMPSSPASRPPSAIPPSPVPTVGEHMNVDEFVDTVDPYPRPQRPGLIQSFWKGLKRLSRLHHGPLFPVPRSSFGSYERHVHSPTVEMPVPGMSVPSEATQYVRPTSSGTETEQRSATPTPYASPYGRPATASGTPTILPGSMSVRGTPTPYTSPYVRPATVGGTPAIPPGSMSARGTPTPYTSPYVRPATVGGTPSIHPGSMSVRGLSPVPSLDIPPPITVISPSDPSSPGGAVSMRSASVRMPTPARWGRRRSASALDVGGTTEEGGSQTLHEPVYNFPTSPVVIAAPIPVRIPAIQNPTFSLGDGTTRPPVTEIERASSLSSTMARIRRFVTDIDGLPWMSDAQIADEYVPEMNPRSRLRTRMRQGAEPSWYNPRPEVVERPPDWSEWDTWAKQSTAALWDVGGQGKVGRHGADAGAGGGGLGQWGPVYPQGYVPVQQPGYLYPSGYPPG